MKYFLLLLAGMLTSCSLPPTKPSNAEALARLDTEIAILDLTQDDPENAKLYLLEASHIAPRDPTVLVGEGYYAEQIGETTLAATHYHEALSLAPNDPKINNDYGTFLYREGQYAAALPYFLKAGNDPTNLYAAEALQNAGLTELKLKTPTQARTYFTAALKQAPTLQESQAMLEYLEHKK